MKYLIIAGLALASALSLQAQTAPECGECKGGVTALALAYYGDTADVMITSRQGDVVYSGVTSNGNIILLEGDGKHGRLPNEVELYVDGAYQGDIHLSCSEVIGTGMVFGDFVVVGGESRFGGLLCDATGETQPDDADDDDPDDTDDDPDDTNDVVSCECSGGATELVFQYNGADAEIGVVQRKQGDLLFQQGVASGGYVSVSGTWKAGKLGNEIILFVDGEIDAVIHTSCSEPLEVGMTWGSFTLVAGTSAGGGELCDSVWPPDDEG